MLYTSGFTDATRSRTSTSLPCNASKVPCSVITIVIGSSLANEGPVGVVTDSPTTLVLQTQCHLYASTCSNISTNSSVQCIVWTMFLLVFERLNKNCTVDKLSRYIGPPWNPSHAAASTFSQESIDQNFTHLTPVSVGRSHSFLSSMDVYGYAYVLLWFNSFWRFQLVHQGS